MRIINTAGLELIKSFEGFRASPYRDSAGIWTIGYGHTHNVTAQSLLITQEEAEALLRTDLAEAEAQVQRCVTAPLNDNQYAALVSLVYNTGPAPLQCTLGRKLAAQDYKGAAEEFLKWNHAGGELSEGLTRRRAAEKALFCMR